MYVFPPFFPSSVILFFLNISTWSQWIPDESMNLITSKNLGVPDILFYCSSVAIHLSLLQDYLNWVRLAGYTLEHYESVSPSVAVGLLCPVFPLLHCSLCFFLSCWKASIPNYKGSLFLGCQSSTFLFSFSPCAVSQMLFSRLKVFRARISWGEIFWAL